MEIKMIITREKRSECLIGGIDEYFQLPRKGESIIHDKEELKVASVTHDYDDNEIILRLCPA